MLVHNSYQDLDVFNACIFEDELWDVRSEIILSEILRKDIEYHYSNNKEYFYTSPCDESSINISHWSKWRKALYYFVFDRKIFWRKLKNKLKNKGAK